MPRPISCVLAVVLAVASIASGSRARAEEPRARVARAPVPLDGIAAVVDEITIFRSEVIARARHFEDKLSKDPTKRRTELVDLHKQVLGRLIDEILIAKDATKIPIEVSAAEVSTAITTVAQSNNLDRKRLEAEVLRAGFSLPEYQEEIRRQVLEQRWLMARASGKIERSKNPDPATFQAAIEKQRELLLGDLRRRTFIEIR